MKGNKEQSKPNISGVSEEMQNSIKRNYRPKPHKEGNQSFLSDKRIGISVSDNEELEELGYSTIHLKDLIIEIVRNLLVNGATIVYGGNMNKEGYTYLFSELAFQYRDKSDSKKNCFKNYFAYPIYCLLTSEDRSNFKKYRTEIIKVVPPKEVISNKEKYLIPNTTEAKIIWARSLTIMRQTMIADSDARILVGGKLSYYSGKMPGIIEEAKLTLEQGKPLYLIGALGGASKEVINALEGKGFSYLENKFHQSEEYQAFKGQYNKGGNDSIDPEVELAFFKNYGKEILSRSNGLTPEENERLFTTSNLPEMLFYILKGLKNITKP